MRVLIGPSMLLCSFVSLANGGAWVPEKDSGKLVANRIDKEQRAEDGYVVLEIEWRF